MTKTIKEQERIFIEDVAKAEEKATGEVSEEIKKERVLIKKIERKDKINKYFSKDNPIFERLGAGIHKGNYYFGIRVWDEEKQKFFNAIITDSKEIFIDEQITKTFGIHYNSCFEEPDFVWKNKAIEEYLNEKIKNIDKRKCFEELVLLQDKGIIWNEKEKSINRSEKTAVKIMASYFHPVWSNFERESSVGGSTFGKTKKDTVPYYCGFNTIKIAKQTESDLFRSIDATCSWIFSDNRDYENEEQQRTINQIVELGFSKKGGYARTRTNNKKTGKFESEKKAISGFINYTSINPLDKGFVATMNRIDLNWNTAVLTENPEDKKKFTYDYDQDKKFLEVAEKMRNQLRILAFENWKEVKEINDKIELPFTGRFLDKCKPMLVIAEWLGKDVFEKIINYYETKRQDLLLDSLESDTEFKFFEKIANMIYEAKSWLEIPVSELINHWFDIQYAPDLTEDDFAIKKKLRFKAEKEVPKMLKASGVFQRKNIGNRRVAWLFKLQSVEYLRLSRGYVSIKEIKEKIDQALNHNEKTSFTTSTSLSSFTSLTSFNDLVPFFAVFDNENEVNEVNSGLMHGAEVKKNEENDNV